MNFNSIKFIIFFPIVLFVYFIIPKKYQWLWLLICSYYFYLSWNLIYGSLIFACTLLTYVASIIIDKSKSKKIKKIVLIITFIFCLGTLFVFKYSNFILENVISFLNLFNTNIKPFKFNILLPVGISFYTFQTMSYVIDVYRGNQKAEYHFGYYALFVSFFPQLVAGPIERTENLLPQLKEYHYIEKENFRIGIEYMLMGFFRKCVVSDVIGIYVNNVFSNLSIATSFSILIAGILFLFQIYSDFAGYSEIAIGASRIMGIRLMNNFHNPYLATSVKDLMRRWHISLNLWFRDYLYIPLGGNRKGKLIRIRNVLIVYALCGFWHGANWNYILWGLYVALFLLIEDIVKNPIKSFANMHNINLNSQFSLFVRRIIVFIVFLFAGFIFRCQNLNEIGLLFTKLFTTISFGSDEMSKSLSILGMNSFDIIIVTLLLISLLLIALMNESNGYKQIGFSFNNQTNSRTEYIISVILIVCIAVSWIYLESIDSISEFAYFQF